MKKLFDLPVLARVVVFVLVGALVLGALTIAGVKLVRAAELPIWAYTIDSGGSNDATAQGDLTRMGTDINPANMDSFGLSWSWDDEYGTQSYYACAFFDNDPKNGMVDHAVCVQLMPDATGMLIQEKAESFTCDDKWNDRCGQPVGPVPVTYCSVHTNDEDPFPGDPLIVGDEKPGGIGSDYPYDTEAQCLIPNVDAGGPTATLTNVCSFTSVFNPNSNPTDCLVANIPAGAWLTVQKIADPDVEVPFNFSVTGPTSISPFTIYGSGTSSRTVVTAGSYTIGETSLPAGWTLDSVACTDAGVPITITGTNPITVSISSYDDILCTFTNAANVDLAVTKSDDDYEKIIIGDDGNNVLSVGEGFTYDIQVTYPGTGATAYNVEVVDTLDPSVKYISSSGAACVASSLIGGGTVTCDLGDMNPLDEMLITIEVEVLADVDPYGLIETGTCDQETQTGTSDGFYYGDPPVYIEPVTGAVDICNVVSVTTTSNDVNENNDTDSEPTDIAIPTAVDLLYFEGTGAKRSVILEWATASEFDTIGFNIYRRRFLGLSLRPVNTMMIQAVSPGAVEGATYSFVVEGLRPGKFYYFWLEDVDMYGNTTLHGPIYVKAKWRNP